MTALAPAFEAARAAQPLRIVGRVASLRGLTVLVEDLPLPVGALVARAPHAESPPWLGEVVGFTREHAVVMALSTTAGVSPGDEVVGEQPAPTCQVGPSLLGRVVDALGRPIDDKGPIRHTLPRPLDATPIRATRRRRIRSMLATGVRALDLMTPLGRGQRLGIFAGPGVGKSTLLGAIARGTEAQASVIALIGERGREVKDFLEHSLGPAGLARSVVVVATGDESPLMRLRAAKFACAQAEFLRDRGLDVLLMMDSITRFAHAQRQVGLSVGEPPATKGYTPSVFAQLALLLERAGSLEEGPGRPAGSITGLYTILVEGDDLTEPVSDAARGILDGHVVLSRKIAQKGHYPAIDVLDSVSRVADDVTTPEHAAARRQLAKMLAAYRDVEDLVQIGAYAKGTNPDADAAIEHRRAILDLLRQPPGEPAPFEPSRAALLKLAKETADHAARAARPRAR